MRTNSTAPATAALATVVHTGQNILAPGNGSGLSVFDSINKGDIAMAVRVDLEQRLNREHAEATGQLLNKLNARLIILNAEIDKLASAAVKGVDTDAAQSAANSLNKAFGLKAEAAVELAARHDERRRFRMTITLSTASTYGRSTIGSKEVTVAYDGQAIELLKEQKLLQREVKAIQTRLIGIKRDIGDLPAREREAHAALVKIVLNNSKDGQALLRQLHMSAMPALVEIEAAA